MEARESEVWLKMFQVVLARRNVHPNDAASVTDRLLQDYLDRYPIPKVS